jgi:hypothetical protein
MSSLVTLPRRKPPPIFPDGKSCPNCVRNFTINHNKYSILLDISPYLCHISTIKFFYGGDMGYKQIGPIMTFAEVSLLRSMEHNRNLKRLEKINQVINWSKVDDILMSH